MLLLLNSFVLMLFSVLGVAFEFVGFDVVYCSWRASVDISSRQPSICSLGGNFVQKTISAVLQPIFYSGICRF